MGRALHGIFVRGVWLGSLNPDAFSDQTTILYPESSGSLANGWSSGKTEGKSKKKLIFLIGSSVTACIVLPQKFCGNKIPVPQNLSW